MSCSVSTFFRSLLFLPPTLTDVRTENAGLRQVLKDKQEKLHKLNLQIKHVLDGNKEASDVFEREASNLDHELKLQQQHVSCLKCEDKVYIVGSDAPCLAHDRCLVMQDSKARRELEALEQEYSSRMATKAHLERELRRLRQQTRNL